MARRALNVTNLLYTSDSHLFFIAFNETDCILQVLHQHAKASRQYINLGKATIVFSANSNVDLQDPLANKLGVSWVESQEQFLGLASFIGRNKKAFFPFIRDKTRRRLQGWNEKFLSLVRKEILP